MSLVGIIQEIMVLGQAILSHFVTGTAATFTATGDREWFMTGGSFSLSDKGNYLAGAVADIAVYGAILVDWIVQALLNTQIGANNMA
jgi:hypothetical protein